MLVDGDDRIQLELYLLPFVGRPVGGIADVIIRRLRMAVPPVLVADPALPFHVVDFFLQRSDANAQAVEFVGKFSGEAIDHGAVSTADVGSRHSPSHHLRHFVAGNLLVPPISTVAVALDDAVGGKLCHRVVGPVICRYILKGIGGGVTDRICGHDGCCGSSGG